MIVFTIDSESLEIVSEEDSLFMSIFSACYKFRFVEQTAQQEYTIFPGPFPSCALIASNNMDPTW
jgi:hypothetical protein